MRAVEDIAEEGAALIQERKADIRRIAVRVVALLVVALALEVFLFNMNFFRSASYNPIDLADRITLDQVAQPGSSDHGLGQDTQFRFTESSSTVEFHDLNTAVHSIHLDFDNSQAAQNLNVKISFTDAGHETYFSTTEYTYGPPEVTVSTHSEQSQYLYLESSGTINDLKIEITGDDVTYPVILNTVVLNDHQAFDFNGARFFITFALLLLAYVFRPRSSIYRCLVREHPRFSRAVIVCATACEIAVLCIYL